MQAWLQGELALRLAAADQAAPALTLSGRVIDARDEAIADVVVTVRSAASGPFSDDLRRWSARSAPDGRFVITDLAGGTYTLTASAPGLVPVRVEDVAAGASEIVLRLVERGGSIAGQVVADPDARPVPSFVVVLAQAAGKLEERPVATRSYLDAQGSSPSGRSRQGPTCCASPPTATPRPGRSRSR